MTLYAIDPLADARWSQLVDRHPRASIFHTSRWLKALKRTYAYQPTVYTMCAPGGELRSGVVFCDVRSWLTGARLVSLPFSDHCDPLTDSAEELTAILDELQMLRQAHRWRYIELRPFRGPHPSGARFGLSAEYLVHFLPLDRDVQTVFRRFHKSSTQRKIRRAQREGLTCEQGRDPGLLKKFYELHVRTRSRHGLPPQPFEWFRNLADCLDSWMLLRVASYRERPVAAIVTLRHGATLVYKYGASDVSGHRLGAMQLLFWEAIQDASQDGCAWLDLGRTDLTAYGLSRFKERWGAGRQPLYYWKSPVPRSVGGQIGHSFLRRGIDRVPTSWRIALGKALYRHFG